MPSRFLRPMSSHVRALVYQDHGQPTEVLECRDLPAPKTQSLGPHDIYVQMLAAPINPSDVNTVEGRYPLLPEVPAVGGHEGAGRVLAVGAAVTRFSVGDTAVPLAAKQGTWRSHAVFDERAWCRVPSELPLSVSSCLTVNPPTAICLLRDFESMQSGDWVLQNGATSTVGKHVIQLARHRGLRTLNVVRDRPAAARAVVETELKAMGADEVVTAAELRALMLARGDRAPAIRLGLDCVGGADATAVAKALAPGGTMVTYGAMSKAPLTLPPSLLIFKNISFRGFWLSGHFAGRNPLDKEKLLLEAAQLFQQRVFKPTPVKTARLDDFRRAFDMVQQGGAKVLLLCDDDDDQGGYM